MLRGKKFWLALGIVLLLQGAWFGLYLGQKMPLAFAEWLDALGASSAVAEGVLDALFVLPLLGLAALLLGLARGRPEVARAPRWAVFAPLAAAAAFLAVFFAEREYYLYRFSAVCPGVLYRSAQTGLATLARLVEENGIRTVIFLREPGPELDRERAFCAARGLNFRHIPMNDPAAGSAAFLEVLDQPANRPILIHCRFGVGRTGIIAAVYRMEYEGWDNRRALGEAHRYQGEGDASRDSSKAGFILNYVPRGRRGAAPAPAPGNQPASPPAGDR